MNEEVHLYEVMAWAQTQAQYLSAPSHTIVLWYLCANAWCTPDNKEGAAPGDVLSARTSLRKIQMGTGLSARAVRYALDALQDAGYIVAKHRPGNGQSEIAVLWFEEADEIRAEMRAGVRSLPDTWKREIKRRPKAITGIKDGNIVQFRSGN